ncbi:DUF975 family protein [Miniphocaeibacter massiliensis]|uniref:DUF975 family protein n=1 Tax=Miniphocaeibacter massiliensis TaxID=2041841 RepID=UPI0013EA8252|nr:DUF975 family protein [Miniphocaeibacter massiliensis]
MWNRVKLKADAKEFLSKNLTNSILACLIFTIIVGFFALDATFSDNVSIFTRNKLNETIKSEERYYDDFLEDDDYDEILDEDETTNFLNKSNFELNEFLNDPDLVNGRKGLLTLSPLGTIGNDLYGVGGFNVNNNLFVNFFSGVLSIKIPILFLGLISLIFFVLRILFINPLTIGLKSFFLKGYSEIPKVKFLFSYFKDNSWTGLASKLFLRDIYLTLWTICFIIPGIIKFYEYYYVEYILAENPEMSLSDAIELSRQMTYGEKFDIFVLEISFFGWALLSLLSFNIGSIILNPYMEATYARLYLFKKEQRKTEKEQEYFDYYNEVNNN